ncbi:hypothetical protein RI367_007877, partial [Sorochytrium milnesiophthora]
MRYIVLLGDSITQGCFSVANRGWAARLADRFQRRLDVTAREFSGYNTNDYVRIIARVVQDLHRVEDCAVATLYLGTNDVAQDGHHAAGPKSVGDGGSEEEYPPQSNPQHVPVDAYAQPPHAHCAAMREAGSTPRPNAVMREYAAAAVKVVQLAQDNLVQQTTRRKLVALDLYATMEPFHQPPPAFTDGLHFDGLGNDIVFQELVRAIDTQLPITSESVRVSGATYGASLAVTTIQKHQRCLTATVFSDQSKASLFNQLLASAAALTPSSAEPAAAEQDQEQSKTPAAAASVDYFSGNKLVPNSQPWSHCYGGHQFGSWAGQLGDGRAISLGEYVNKRGERWEVQLKGAGNTPYSRFGDGFAVLRSSIREYLCSEHFYALGVPTSRAAALVTSKEQLVHREELEPGAIVARLAPTWIRFGSFEIFNSRGDLANLLRLANYTATRFFTDQVTANGQYDLLQANVKADKPTAVHNMYARMFAGVVESTARMISKWNGGPYGFLDHYDPAYIVNHSDDMGRYAYQNQPMIALWNLNKLAIAIVELCGLPERPQQARQRMVDESPFANGVAKSATAPDDTAAVADDVYEQILKGEFWSEQERKKRLEQGRDAVIEVL